MDMAVNPAPLQEAMDRPLRVRWWRRRGWQQLFGAGVALLLAVLAVAMLLGPAQRTLRIARSGVSIAAVQQGLYHDFIPLNGQVVPRDTVFLDALEGGLVTRVLAHDGDRVTQGQALVEFSNTALELEVRTSESNTVQSITSLRKLETQLELDRARDLRDLADMEDEVALLQSELRRRESLSVSGAYSEVENEQFRSKVAGALRKRDLQRNSNERLEALRLQQQPEIKEQVATLQESLRITHEKLRSLTVRAPTGGLLTAMDMKVGETRGRGVRLAEITPDTGFNLSATVDEYYLGRVREGQVASIEHEGGNWSVRVTRVYPQVKDGGFKVDLTFTGDAPAGLLRGQSLRGRLSLGEDQSGLVLASGPFLEASGGSYVFVLAADGSFAQRRRIKLGRRSADQVEVLSGLNAGEQVIVSDYTGLDRIDRIHFK